MRNLTTLFVALALTACDAPAPEPPEPAAADVAQTVPSAEEVAPQAAAAPAQAAPAAAAPVDPEPSEADGAGRTNNADAADAQPTANSAATVATKPATPVAAAPAAAATTVAASYRIAGSSKVSFLIDAPLEKIKGRWSRSGGSLTIDPGKLAATRGEVTVDLLSLATHTFGDPGKDAKQGEHALNWMEVGSEVNAATRQRNRSARFVIERVDAPADAQPGAGPVTVTAHGKLTLHGKTFPKTVKLQVSFDGAPQAPSAVHIKSLAPLAISLAGHDIKPRDLAGRFLAGALDKVGQKIADRVQVTVQLDATRQ